MGGYVMQPGSRVLVGPAIEVIQAAAFEIAADLSSTSPESVLLVDGNRFRWDSIRRHWRRENDPLRLVVTDLRSVVEDCYESLEGPSARLPAITRRRLLARALREAATDRDRPHLARHAEDFTELVTLVEAAGDAAIDRLTGDPSSLPRPDHGVLAAAIGRYRDLLDEPPFDAHVTQLETYRRVLDSDRSIGDLLGPAEVVVIAGELDASPLERRFVRAIVEDLPVVAFLPQATQDSVDGVDAVLADELEVYRDLGLPVEFVPDDEGFPGTAGRMYRPTAAGEPIEPPAGAAWIRAPAPDREVRAVARAIRRDLAAGVDPDDVLVVVPGLISYLERIADSFEQAGIEFAPHTNRLLYQLNVGRAVLDALELCAGDARTGTLAALATNPMVDLGHPRLTKGIVDLCHRLPSDDVEVLVAELDAEEAATPLEALLEAASACRDADPAGFVETFEALLADLEIPQRIEHLRDAEPAGFDARMELAGYDDVRRSLEVVDTLFDHVGSTDPIDELDDALQRLRVRPRGRAPGGVVDVVGPREAYMSDYTHLYLVGLTAESFPLEADRPRFFDELVEALPVEPGDDRARARHRFQTMVSNAESVVVTTPETGFDDESRLESPVLDEFRRVSGIEPDPVDPANATAEDVQRALSRLGADELEAAVDHAADSGALTPDQRERVLAGSACAANRASAGLTAHDGRLDPATVDRLHPAGDRLPVSPTRLGTYARCGFRYYAGRVLDLDEPDEYRLEPSGLDVGRLVHDALERFYTGLQGSDHEPVDLGAHPRENLESALVSAVLVEADGAGLADGDVFADRTLRTLLAGLGRPAANPYFGDDAPHDGDDRGLLVRFLDHELETDGRPFAFELEFDRADPYELPTPAGPVPIAGRIDRLDLVDDDGDPRGLVLDYKTGRAVPKRTLEGLDFQLPVYAVAARDRFPGAVEAVDATYYALDAPTGVKRTRSIGESIGRYADGPDALDRFLDDAVPGWVGRIVDAVADGAFQPTVLAPAVAGCRHCAYRDACDVRPHARGDAAEALADAESGYVPLRARRVSLGEFFGGDGE